jgi:sugar-specific transcriptional regulator TrmB
MCGFSLSQDKVLKTLESLGLTQLDAQVYIFLGKRGPQKAVDIAKFLRMSKQTVYRAIKNLERKGIITATLEHPSRFSAVPFEKVLDLFVKAKTEEVHRIEQDKKGLLSDWQSIALVETGDQSPKFTVIEGRNFIYPRLKQMVEDTKSQLSIISTVPSLVRADQFGLLDAAFNHAAKTNTKFRFITELSAENFRAMKTLLEGMPKELGFEGRTPELGLGLISRMLIRDDAEVAFFVSQESDKTEIASDDLCLWTNSYAIINSFKALFEELWHNSTDIQNKITEIETGKPLPKTYLFTSAETANKKYNDMIRSASKEVTILTSSQGLIDIAKQDQLLAEWARKQTTVRIMAPITRDNLSDARQLLQCCRIKHVPIGYMETTTVDGTDLFQFKNPPFGTKQQGLQCFEKAFYSNDPEYVEKTKKMLDDIWRNAQDPPAMTFESPNEPNSYDSDILAENYPTRKRIGLKVVDIKPLAEKEVIAKIIHGKKIHVKNAEKDTHKIYSTAGSAIIHPPNYFNLPDLMLEMAQIESQSSLGAANVLTVYQWLNTPIGIGYAPVAYVLTNAKAFQASKRLYKDTPAGGNVHLVKEDELQIRVHGNTMFAGWTFPIPLLPRKCVLPPAYLTLEGYGKVHSVGYTMLTYYGAKSTVEKNYFDAFVTFMHPRSKYSGPGTDGFFCRDFIVTLQPP